MELDQVSFYKCQLRLHFLQNGDFSLGRDRAVKTTHKTLAQIVCEVQKNVVKRPCLIHANKTRVDTGLACESIGLFRVNYWVIWHRMMTSRYSNKDTIIPYKKTLCFEAQSCSRGVFIEAEAEQGDLNRVFIRVHYTSPVKTHSFFISN